MSIDLGNALMGAVLALQAWILLEIISLKVKLAVTIQKVEDLPCKKCPTKG